MFVHYFNDGTGRDTYVNEASSTTAQSGRVAPSTAAASTLSFWNPNMSQRSISEKDQKTALKQLLSQTQNVGTSPNGTVSSGKLGASLPPIGLSSSAASSPLSGGSQASRRQLLAQSGVSRDATLPFPHHVANVADRSSGRFPANDVLLKHPVDDCLQLSDAKPPKQPFHALARQFQAPTTSTTGGLSTTGEIEQRLRYETSSQRSQRVGLWGSAHPAVPAPTVRSLSVDTNNFAAGRCSRIVQK